MGFICDGKTQKCTICGASFPDSWDVSGHRCKGEKKMAVEHFNQCPYDKAIKCGSGEPCCGCEDYNSEYADKCVFACAGLDMSKVPAGAVQRLVEESFRLEQEEAHFRDWVAFRKVLAPFKE